MYAKQETATGLRLRLSPTVAYDKFRTDKAEGSHIAETALTIHRCRAFFRIKFSPLTDNSSKDMGKYCSLAIILAVRQWETLLEATFGVGTDEMGESSDDMISELGFPSGCLHLLTKGECENGKGKAGKTCRLHRPYVRRTVRSLGTCQPRATGERRLYRNVTLY